MTKKLIFSFGIIYAAIGVFAYVAPHSFFNLLGPYYGVFNYHFVKDAGIAYFSSGVLMVASSKSLQWRCPFLIGGAMFITLHGLFHVQMLVSGMIADSGAILKELAFIIIPALIVFALALVTYRDHQVELGKVDVSDQPS